MMKMPELLRQIGIPFAYDHFAQSEALKPPFITYLYPNTNHFVADGKNYFKKIRVNLELYTDLKDLTVERKVESVLDDASIVYAKSENWISSEKLYEVLYEFEMKED